MTEKTSVTTVDEALEHPEVKEAIRFVEETAFFAASKMYEVLHNLVERCEHQIFLTLNRVAVDNPDALAAMLCNSMNDALNSTMPGFSNAKKQLKEALRGHIDNVHCNLGIDVNGKIVRK